MINVLGYKDKPKDGGEEEMIGDILLSKINLSVTGITFFKKWIWVKFAYVTTTLIYEPYNCNKRASHQQNIFHQRGKSNARQGFGRDVWSGD